MSKNIVFINPKSFGIKNSHEIMSNALMDDFSVVTTSKISRCFSPSVSVVFLAVHHFYLIIMLRIIGKKVVFVCHGRPNFHHYSIVRYILLKFLIWFSENFSNLNVFVSRKTQGASKGIVFHNIIDEISPQTIFAKPNRVVYFGRISRTKGILQLLDIAQRYKKINFDLFGYIESDVKDAVSLASTFGNVQYHGAYNSFRDLFEKNLRGSIFVSLNFDEPFGMVFIEAIRLGLIPLVPSGSGAAEVIVGAPIIGNLSEFIEFIENNEIKSFEISALIKDDRHILRDWLRE